MSKEKILVIDFGDQSAMILAQYIRKHNVYSEVVHFSKCMESIQEEKPIGIVLASYEGSINDSNAPFIPNELLQLGIPVLGVAYGMHIIVKLLGGKIEVIEDYDFDEVVVLYMKKSSNFFSSQKIKETIVDMPHDNAVVALPDGFEIAGTFGRESKKIGAIEDVEHNIYGVQFVPSVSEDVCLVSNYLSPFLFEICQAKKSWNLQTFLDEKIKEVKEQVGNKKVLLALSGGIDSTVLAHLLNKAISDRLICVFVDTGLMRKNESEEIKKRFENQEFRFLFLDAKEKFIKALSGIIDPEEKRHVIGETFIRVFEESAKEIGNVDFLAQGTIYADVIESGATKDGKLVKSHHNVGGLPSVMDFKGIVEPFRELLKGEVKEIGKLLGLSKAIINRQPFPGPGLAIRVIGEVTEEKLAILREADYIWRSAIEEDKELNEQINQYFAVLTDMRSVGVKNGVRTYGYVLALRCIKTIDFMSADTLLPSIEVFNEALSEIEYNIPEITRVVFDLSSKPPATIEWE